MNKLLFFFLTTLSLNADAFGTVGGRVAHTAYSNAQSARSSPLFVATGINEDSLPSAVKNIEAKMAKAQKQREKYEAKLSAFNSKIADLENQKKQYLEGSSIADVMETNFVETTARSAVKAMMWRVVAGSVTFITTLKFSGNINYALKVVGSDFFSKAATMFIGERLMNKSSAGRKGGADAVGRSVAKALIWRVFAICNTLAVCFFVSKDFSMASKIAGSDAIFKTFLMIAYERVWAKVEWGKEYEIDFAI